MTSNSANSSSKSFYQTSFECNKNDNNKYHCAITFLQYLKANREWLTAVEHTLCVLDLYNDGSPTDIDGWRRLGTVICFDPQRRGRHSLLTNSNCYVSAHVFIRENVPLPNSLPFDVFQSLHALDFTEWKLANAHANLPLEDYENLFAPSSFVAYLIEHLFAPSATILDPQGIGGDTMAACLRKGRCCHVFYQADMSMLNLLQWYRDRESIVSTERERLKSATSFPNTGQRTTLDSLWKR